MGIRSVWVVVPTINEGENLAHLLPRLLTRDAGWSIVVVDDGSHDATRPLLRQLTEQHDRLHAVFRDRRGLGSALRAGMAYALGHGATRIVTMDADLSHDPDAVPTLLEADADIVLGSRYAEGGDILGWPRRRKIISFMANRLSRFSLGTVERDLTTGFRAYTRTIAKLLVRESVAQGYSFQVEAVNLARKHGLSIAEVPITFRERLYGDSKLAGSREGAGLFRLLATRTPLRTFMLVILIGALINEAVLITLVGGFALHYLVAGLAAVEAGVLSSFILNEKWTFKGRPRMGTWSTRFNRYHAVVLGGLTLNILILFLLTEFASISPLWANIFGVGTAVSWNYLVVSVVRPF